MIKVFVRTSNQQVVSFEIHGHAGFDVNGKDIVCAAVSVLAYNCINSCEVLAGTALHVTDTGQKMSVSIPQNVSKEVCLLISSFVLGIEQISQQYPEYVQIYSIES